MKKAFSFIELSVVILIIGILVAGVTKTSRMVTQFRLSTAKTLTQSSPVVGVKDLIIWFDSISDASFNEAETEDGATVMNWYGINPTRVKLNAVQNNPANRPTYEENMINNLPALKFNGTNQYYEMAYHTDLNPSNFTIFTVNKVSSVADFGAIISSRSTTGGPLAGYTLFATPASNFEIWLGNGTDWGVSQTSSPFELNKTYVISATYNGGTLTTYSNGISAGSRVEAGYKTNNDRNLKIGAGRNESTAAYYFGGYIGEIIIFDRALKNEERNSIEKYLGQKWGVKIS